MHVLLIEDDLKLGSYVQKALREHGHLVDHAVDGRDGLIRASTERYDTIVLDRMLPSMDGLKILQTIRATGDRTPVLILSALGAVDEKVSGLRAGGDDYVTKPFAMSELVARLEVLERRGPADHRPTRLVAGDLVLDLAGHSVRRAGSLIELTPREFRVLEYLMRNVGRVVTRSMLLEAVWDYNFDPQTNVIDQYIRRLRQKIGDDSNDPLIQTVRGSGYCIQAPA